MARYTTSIAIALSSLSILTTLVTPQSVIAQSLPAGKESTKSSQVSALNSQAQSSESSESPLPGSSAVLLKNNRVMYGVVEPRGNVVTIRVADNSSVSIPLKDIQAVKASLRELYEFKVQSIPIWKVGDHFNMTRWCGINGLLDEAVEHYQKVAAQAGQHPRVQQLALELRNQLLEDPAFRDYLGLPQKSALENTPSKLTETSAASASQLATGVRTASAVHLAAASVDSVYHPQIVRSYADKIQPILLNRCSQSACHGGQSTNSLRIIAPYGRNGGLTTAENLRSVLLQLDRPNGDTPTLIRYATQAHGLQRQPAIGLTETRLLQELQAWISFTENPVITAGGTGPTDGSDRAELASSLTPVAPLTAQLKTVPKVEAGSVEMAMPPNTSAPNNGFPPGLTPPSASELDALEAELDLLEAGAGQAKDPFDPQEFNRNVHRVQ